MDLSVFGAVLLAALMHAGWNGLVKVGLDRFSSLLVIVLAQMGLSCVLLPFFPWPSAASWPWILASGLVHTCYKLTLIRAYEHGELSQIYPIARGSAPLLVAGASILILGEAIAGPKILAIAAIGLGVCLMTLRSGAAEAMSPKALGYALATAGCTASYTLIDGIGARLSEAASGFILIATIVDGIFTCSFALSTRGKKAFAKLKSDWRSGAAAGVMSHASYWIAVWAFTQAPIALVAALRETSVLFALLIAVIFLKERASAGRIVAACLITCGVALMRV
jgi:drug/metabolite transporter (DMT)-like permease